MTPILALYLVTGAAGFIGCSLARALLERGESVRGLDNFSTGSRANIRDLLDRPTGGMEFRAGARPTGARPAGAMEFREADLCDLAALQGACAGVDFVFHQAARPSVSQSVEDPIATHIANLNGTLNLLLAARDCRVKRVVYASSAAVYGDNASLASESRMPDPISPYAVQKRGGELYMRSFSKIYGLETVSLRYFNFFGPYQNSSSQYSGVIAKFCMQMLRGQRPVIYGDGGQTRDFTYVENIVQANLLAATAPAEKVAGECFNIASGKSVTVTSLAAMLKRMTGYKGELSHEKPLIGDVRQSQADISSAQKSLGYEFSISLEAGLEKTVEWYRANLN